MVLLFGSPTNVNYFIIEMGLIKITWNQSGSDDDIHIFALVMEKFHFSFEKFFGHFFCVPSNSFALFLNVDLKKFCPHRFDLLFHGGTHVKCLIDKAET